MVGALDRGDAVDLDEAQPLDQPCKIFSLGRAPKAVPVEEQVPGQPGWRGAAAVCRHCHA